MMEKKPELTLRIGKSLSESHVTFNGNNLPCSRIEIDFDVNRMPQVKLTVPGIYFDVQPVDENSIPVDGVSLQATVTIEKAVK